MPPVVNVEGEVTEAMPQSKVFISYSHDSDMHRERVLGLSERLRHDGVETSLDRYVEGLPAEGWPRWMLNGLDAATHVLCVCTEIYYRRFRGQEVASQGKGVDWEGAFITQALYDAKCVNRRFIPVLYDRADESHIPEPLRGQTFHLLDSEANYRSLYDQLLGQAGVTPGEIGEIKTRPRPTGKLATFGTSSKPTAVNERRVDISRIVKYAPERLIGRETETAMLDKVLSQMKRGTKKRPHVLGFVALGGEGKTSLVAKWLGGMAGKDWPGCESVFAWSFYSQGSREQVAVSSDLFLAEALKFFGDPEMAGSAVGAYEKGQRLAELVGGQRSLLILDGVEPLQYPPSSPTGSRLKDQGVEALLKGLAASSNGLCIVTTRYSIPDLAAFVGSTWHEEELKRLSREAGVALLKDCGVKGSERPSSGNSFDPKPQAKAFGDAEDAHASGSRSNEQSDPLNEYEQLVEDVKGHALTLQILGQYLKRAHHGDIRRRDRVELAKADDKVHASHGFGTGHAFRAIAAYEAWLADDSEESRRELAALRLLGLFDRPATGLVEVSGMRRIGCRRCESHRRSTA
jgi:hypothetical protein